MPPDTLEFEEPIALLLKEVEALSMLPVTAERQRSLDSLNMRIDSLRGEIYKNLTPWQRVQVARHPNRPTVLDYTSRLFTEFTEISGDRRFADDHAIVAGFATDHPAATGFHEACLGRDRSRGRVFFELLLAHWDVPLNHLDLDSRKPSR